IRAGHVTGVQPCALPICPSFYEAVRDHPGLKVTLAHLGWPWCDEANAVGVIDLINGVHPDDSQFRFDISFGPPPVYRRRVLADRSEERRVGKEGCCRMGR